MHRIDEFLNDATARARIQMDRAEMVLDDAMVRTQHTAVAVVEGGILKPIVQIQGVAAGIKTAITFLLRGRLIRKTRAFRRRDVYQGAARGTGVFQSLDWPNIWLVLERLALTYALTVLIGWDAKSA